MNERGMFSAFLSLFLLAAISASGQTLPVELVRYADFVFYNGPVLTIDTDQGDFTIAQAVAVRDGKILAVGPTDRILSLAGPSTKRVDLQGRTLMPGYINTHTHPMRTARTNFQDLIPAQHRRRPLVIRSDWKDKAQVLGEVRRLVQSVPPDVKWIAISGVQRTSTVLDGVKTEGLRPVSLVAKSLTRHDLDTVAPDRPVSVQMRAHYGVGNTKAVEHLLEMFGKRITGIERDANGQPTGRLIGPAMDIVPAEIIPELPAEVLKEAFGKELEQNVAPTGTTTFSSRARAGEIRAYMLLDLEGKMPVRYAYGHEIGRFNPLFERDMQRSMESPLGFGSDKVWLNSISVGLTDGNPGSSDLCSTYEKIRKMETNTFDEAYCNWKEDDGLTINSVLNLAQAGYRVANIHTFGDLGVEIAFDTYLKGNGKGQRFAVDHGQLFNPNTIKKAGELKAYVSVSAGQLAGDRGDIIAYEMGEEVANSRLAPVKALLDAGARVTVEDDNPFEALQIFVTRVSDEGKVRGAQHAVDRRTALRMLTRWGAEYVLREDVLGTIEPGKFADLIVLDRNPLDPTVPDNELGSIKVLMTMVGGKVVFDAATAPPRPAPSRRRYAETE